MRQLNVPRKIMVRRSDLPKRSRGIAYAQCLYLWPIIGTCPVHRVNGFVFDDQDTSAALSAISRLRDVDQVNDFGLRRIMN